MPDDINGNYSLPNGYLAVTGEKVLPSNHNPPLEDMATAMTARYSRDGRAPMLGDVPMNGFRVTGMADATEEDDAVNKKQLSEATAILSVAKWVSKAIGELYAVDDSMAGADVPPTNDSRFRYIKLTAGLTGAGQYNDGILTTESVSGSAPLVSATAVVNLTGSPVNGRTVRLLNTESRFLRAGTSPGTVQDDQMQQITGVVQARGSSSNDGSVSGAFSTSDYDSMQNWLGNSASLSRNTIRFDSANSPDARAGNETRSKNIQLTYYMRIK